MLPRGPCSLATVVLTCAAACGAAPPPSLPPAPLAAAPEREADVDTKTQAGPPTSLDPEPPADPEPAPPQASPPPLVIQYPAPREIPSGAVAAALGPIQTPQGYCDAYMRSAPPKQQFNANITVDSECTVLRDPTSDEYLSPAEPLPALGSPYRDVVLIRARTPYDDDEGPDESWDDFEEIRVGIVTERGAFVEERGIEIANWLPASAVALRSATVKDTISGGEPELRISLELFIGADEGVAEQFQAVELICGFGASGAFACARFESAVKTSDVPRSPVTARALRRLVLP
jgi:hypothetical protein